MVYSDNGNASNVECWGADNIAQRANDVQQLSGDRKWIQVLPTTDFFCAIDSEGQLSCWGNEDSGVRTLNGTYQVGSPDADGLCLVTNEGNIECMSNNNNTQFNPPSLPEGVVWEPNIAGTSATCAIASNSQAVSDNAYAAFKLDYCS